MTNDKKVLLNVPYVSQVSDAKVIDEKGRERNIVDPFWRSRACGPASLKMVIEFFGSKRTPLIKIIWKGLELGAYSCPAGGWYHEGLVKIAKHYGFFGRRKEWENASAGAKYLKTLIKKGVPPIVSVFYKFKKTNSGHLIVLTGWKEVRGKLMGFYYNDPESRSRTEGKNKYVDVEKFEKHWRKRAVIIKKQEI